MYHIKNLEQYLTDYKYSVEEPELFWEGIAKNNFTWQKKWDKVLSFDFSKPEFKWFEGAKLNITENCIDRHLKENGNKTAIIFEPNDPKEKEEHISLSLTILKKKRSISAIMNCMPGFVNLLMF